MAIFSINDSSLDEYLNEHGGAHRKYVEMKFKEADKQSENAKKDYKKSDILNDLAKNQSFKNSKKIKNLANQYADRAFNRERKASALDSEAAKYDPRIITNHIIQLKNNKNKDDEYANYNIENAKKYGQKSKREFQERFGGKSKDTINTNDRKPGTYLDAQKKLKEAAEYIISVLDEMEYTE